ncbi:MAG: beta-ketoacyl synthase [Gammaproteobacteria bacterium]|nr:beta-ketoacyl synthase [Gammaproteobacteria bacterium]
MVTLPIIVGMGGINASGRTSFHQGFRRIIIEKLTSQARQDTYIGLASLMNLIKCKDGVFTDQDNNVVAPEQVETLFGEQILAGTLIRKIENNHFDPDATHCHKNMTLHPSDGHINFTTRAKDLPQPLPSTWTITKLEDGQAWVEIEEELVIKHDSYRDNPIKAAGQFPTGFKPETLYNSRYQARGLQATIFGATDAIRSVGIEWDTILDKISPDMVGTYSGSMVGQMQADGLGGLMKNRLNGARVSSKNLALGLNTMPTDFINGYVTGSVGVTHTATGACATFLYNLRTAVADMQSGKIRLAIVGNADSLITPEIIEGFGNMSALANEEGLKRLDNSEHADHRRTSRPFGNNCGFTIGEAAQFFVIMDDALAIEMGANILGSVADVFVNADGIKKSITAPGPGNYITMAKSVALATSIVGADSVSKHSFILAHGSSTPQNRVTESLIYDRVAKNFNINNWPIAAPKAYLGHTIGPASGDQLAWALGIFAHDIMPGITTIDKVADDVHDERLNIAIDHWQCQPMDVAFINSKGFGGNNATATVLSPNKTLAMLTKRYGDVAISEYQQKLAAVKIEQAIYQQQADNGQFKLIYRFGQGMIDDSEIELTQTSMKIPGFNHPIDLPQHNPFDDMV